MPENSFWGELITTLLKLGHAIQFVWKQQYDIFRSDKDVTETEQGQQGIGEHTTEAVKKKLRVLVRGLNSVLS